MWHPKFLLSKHIVPACIKDLSEIPTPNVVLVSQDKPDHCHGATLRQLDPSSSVTTILAEPAAAKRIRGMKHFKPSQIYALPSYSDRRSESIIRFFIPPLTLGGTPGEVTIAFIPAKLDISGLHNAIGITYRPPAAAQLHSNYPNTPPLSSYSTLDLSEPSTQPQNLPLTPPDSPPLQTSIFAHTNSTAPSTPATSSTSTTSTATTSSTLSSQDFPFPSISSTNSISPFRPPAQKTLSVIYSPHGISYPLVRAYASSHLVSAAALPLTAFLHSFDRVQNPWWLGGNINAGLPGGVEIAKNLMAKCWVGAHDEEKENSGLAVMMIAKKKFTRTEVQDMVSSGTRVESLAVGEELVLRA